MINNKINKNIFITLFFLVLFPSFSFAVWADLGGALGDLISKTGTFGLLLLAAASVAFFWGIVKFISTDKKDEAKGAIVWGIIALFVMFTIWGIISFIQQSTITQKTAPAGSSPVWTM